MAVQEFQSTGLHNQCPAIANPNWLSVNDTEGDLVEGELEGKGGSNRASAHDEDITVIRHSD
jgi:hypothetical protein